MKKITLISSAILALLVVSCQKEKLCPESDSEQNNNSFTLKETFNYSQTLTIFDETGKYSVDYIIKSDNKEIFDNEINNFKNMKMKLLFENQVMLKNHVSDKNNLEKTDFKRIDFSKTSIIKIDNVNKGIAKGFELVPNTTDRTSYTVSGTNSRFYILPQFANWYSVYNNSNQVRAQDFYSNNGSTWTYSSEAILSIFQWHDFSSTNTPYRAVFLKATGPFGTSFNCTVSIY
ncbi:MAG: hypothetical protein V4549_04175 [Bacteroidota bacterium]